MLLYAFACFPLTWLISEELQVSDQIGMGLNNTKIFLSKFSLYSILCIVYVSMIKAITQLSFLLYSVYFPISWPGWYLPPLSWNRVQQESFSPGQWPPYSLFDHDIGPMTSTVHGELMEENMKKEQSQHINYNTALYVQPSQWWRVGQAKLIHVHRFASVLASPVTYVPIPVPPSPPFLPAYQSSYCRWVITWSTSQLAVPTLPAFVIGHSMYMSWHIHTMGSYLQNSCALTSIVTPLNHNTGIFCLHKNANVKLRSLVLRPPLFILWFVEEQQKMERPVLIHHVNEIR